nr:PREDICTED: homeobox protein goosecoid-2-like [Bos indicus]
MPLASPPALGPESHRLTRVWSREGEGARQAGGYSWAHGTLFPPWSGLTGRSAPPNRQRQERTVYSKEQLEALKEAFLKNEYPSYQDRLRLAAKLHLDEHRVQV